MSKRSNQDMQSESEPLAKRFANQNENEISIIAEQKLQSARTALDRLDYKNVSILCTELIDSNPSDLAGPLILRSLALERKGELQESILDAERAVKLKESKKAHLRCTFAYLAKALHHLELVKKQPQEEKVSLPKTHLEEFGKDIKRFKNHEIGTPFRRISEDLFLQMASWFDSRALVIFAAASKQLRSSIYGSTELFRSFKMTAKGKSITNGINFFSSKCGNSIRSIDIGVEDELDQRSQELLQTATSPSSSTLELFAVSHQGDLCKLILDVASPCPSLKILSSQRLGKEAAIPWINNQSLTLQSSWRLNLQHLVWNGGSESLVCDETLLKSLQSASRVFVHSKTVPMPWVLRLLSSASSTLVKVNFPRIMEEDVDEFPRMIDLPNLVSLRLGYAPRSKSTGDASVFFQSLQTPKLHHFALEAFRTKELSYLPKESHPKHFSGYRLLDVDTGENAATSLVESIKDWNELGNLQLGLTGMSSEFWNHLIRLLTPLSQENVDGGFGEMPLLPGLRTLTIGNPMKSIQNAPPVSGQTLTLLVASRKSQRAGFSSGQLASIAAGDLSQAAQKRQEPSFCPRGTSSTIMNLNIDVPLAADDEIVSRLKGNVFSLKFRHQIA